MSVSIKLKHSSVQDKAPQPTDLTEGELALNINSASPAAYIKDSAGAVVKLAGVGAVGATDATTTSKGVVQLADAAAVTAGTAGVVVDAAQLKVVADAAAAEDLWDRSGTELTPKNAGDDVFTSGDVKVGGTTAAPNLQIKDDGGIVANTNGLVYDATNKRLGLGTNSPSYALDVAGSTSTARLGKLRILNDAPFFTGANIDGGTNNTGFGTSGNAPVAFFTNNTERARLDTEGRLLVGTSSARAWSGTTGQFQLEGTSSSTSSPFFISNQSNGYGPFMVLGKSRGTSVGSYTIVQNSDILGAIEFAGADGSALRSAAEIVCRVDRNPGAGSMPGRLVFSTTADGSSTPTERMRISQDGYVRLASGTGGIQFGGDTAAANALDDYEEGAWSGDIVGTTTAGSIDWAAGGVNRRKCFYVKIGGLVYFHATFRFDSSIGSGSAGTGNMRITGLPFAPLPDGRQDVVNFGEQGDIVLSAGYRIFGSIEGTTYINVKQVASAGQSTVTGVPMIAASLSRQIALSGCYFV